MCATAATELMFTILVRESGTEPVVRVMVEAPDHDTCQKYVDEVVNVICEKGYTATSTEPVRPFLSGKLL